MSITPTLRRKLSVLLVVPALLFAFPACTPVPAGADAGAGKRSPKATSASDWRVAFAGCMRGEGVDVPDPAAGGTKGLSVDSSNQDALMAAAKKCQAKLGPMPPVSQAEKDAQKAQLQKSMLAAAKCLRDNGIDVADPKPGENITVPGTAPQELQDKCGVLRSAAPLSR
jgi:hypothetical protein